MAAGSLKVFALSAVAVTVSCGYHRRLGCCTLWQHTLIHRSRRVFDRSGLDSGFPYRSLADGLVHGARPLFFLDYFGTGKLEPDVAEQVVAGLSESCKAAGCVLIGGETAEMPGLYSSGEYDLAGSIVGLVDRDRLVTGEGIQDGDILIGLASEGLHTNGYALAQRVLIDKAAVDLADTVTGSFVTFEEALLARHRNYATAVLPILGSKPGLIAGMAHITGGGLIENIPRILPPGLGARIETDSWTPLPIFKAIQNLGAIEPGEMYRVFNMGIGFVLVCAASQSDELSDQLRAGGEKPIAIGTIVRGTGVTLI